LTKALEICTDALRKINVVAKDEPADADTIEVALGGLRRMLLAWQNRGENLWAVTSDTITATTDAQHSFSVGRPLDVQSMRLKRDGIETPMNRMTRNEYDELPVKASQGLPTNFYFDRQRDVATFKVWPVLASASGEVFDVTYIRSLTDPVLTEDTDIPAEWEEAVVYNLAARLCDDYGRNLPNVVARAKEEFRLASAADCEGSVYFVGYDQ